MEFIARIFLILILKNKKIERLFNTVFSAFIEVKGPSDDDKRNALVKAIQQAEDDETIIALSSVLNDLND